MSFSVSAFLALLTFASIPATEAKCYYDKRGKYVCPKLGKVGVAVLFGIFAVAILAFCIVKIVQRFRRRTRFSAARSFRPLGGQLREAGLRDQQASLLHSAQLPRDPDAPPGYDDANKHPDVRAPQFPAPAYSV